MGARPAVAASILDLVGNTPLLPLRRVVPTHPYRILAKLEFLNPGGSVKDRIGTEMVNAAERDGLLKPGGTIVEPTSGNTGVGLALVAAVRGYRTVFVIPDKMSSEKIRLLRAYGARVVVTPSGVPPEHPMSHYSVAQRLTREIPGAFSPNQYENDRNPEAHYRSTAPEIDGAVGAELGAVVGTVGTGGTMSGIGKYFKEHRPNVKIVGVDPKGSVLGPYFKTHTLPPAVPYLVEGIGEDKLPTTLRYPFFDAFVETEDRESFLMARRLAREEGLFVGGSSGAAVVGALRWLEAKPIPEGSTVVVILPDSGDRYLSKFYSDDWMREKGFSEGGATARALLGAKAGTPALVAAEPTATARDVLAELRRYDISQMPVLEAGQNLGTAVEEEVLRRSLDDATVLDRSVRTVLGPPLPEVGADAPWSELLERLRQVRAVLVRDASTHAPLGVLTRHDLVEVLAEEGGTHAV